MSTPEHNRIEAAKNGIPWKKFGPYLSERQWGTVREDYSKFGGAWEFFSHQDSRSRAYRWGEDGIAGISDDQQLLCFALAFWNGKDTILKERLFGLTGNEGNHSEDVKELYYYLDSTPTHSYMKYLYKYPQRKFPYSELVIVNAERDEQDSEYELADTGIFDNSEYFDIYIEYAKADIDDISIKITVLNRACVAAPLHILPTIWFRNTWAWGEGTARPQMKAQTDAEQNIHITHPELGEYILCTDGNIETIFTENETNAERVFGFTSGSKYVKDAFHDFVINKKSDVVNPQKQGTKAAFYFQMSVEAHSQKEITLRLCKIHPIIQNADWISLRLSEANEYYNELQKDLPESYRNIQRQAFAGMMWGKQYYNFNINKWLHGDLGQFPPPELRKSGRNHLWTHLDCHDIISMPDKWEYPWFAAWDTAFHCIPIAHIDAEYAKNLMLMFLNERYINQQGQIPAYEWAFGDVNPPVHAYGCWKIYKIEKNTGQSDKKFLQDIYQKLKQNYAWWLQTQTVSGKYLFGGGFLGLDNVGLLDRGAPLPDKAWLEQMDGTCWMALYSLNLMRIALELAQGNKLLQEDALYYADIFAKIAYDMNHSEYGFWDDENKFYNDTIRFSDGKRMRMNIKNIVDLMALYPVELIEKELLIENPVFAAGLVQLDLKYPEYVKYYSNGTYLLRAVNDLQYQMLIKRLFNPDEFLGNFGVRSLSKVYDKNPYNYELYGNSYTLKYKPEESDTIKFGENSNWRGPVWFPLNYVLINSLQVFNQADPISYSISDLIKRLINIFEQAHNNHDGNILFFEYFNPENGKGCGASHQTGWTGLVASLIFELNVMTTKNQT